MNKNLIFACGAAIVCLGAFDLYVGLSHQAIGEDAFASIAQSFMLLFPGFVFISYSVQKAARLTSLSVQDGQDIVEQAMPLDETAAGGSSVVVAFPLRGAGTGSVTRKPIKNYNK